jgi:nitrite reductase/ring-hydroxylating ferredoxin subunit
MTWIKIFDSLEIAHSSVAENKIVPLKYKDRQFCMMRQNNTFYVSDSKCPHMGTSLIEGRLNAFTELICPLHEYRFDLTADGICHTNCAPLRVYECKQDESGVYFNPD